MNKKLGSDVDNQVLCYFLNQLISYTQTTSVGEEIHIDDLRYMDKIIKERFAYNTIDKATLNVVISQITEAMDMLTENFYAYDNKEGS